MSSSLKDLIGNLLESFDQSKELHSLDLQTQEMLDNALERVVDGTDPKIRLVPGYRRKLSRSILASLEHADNLINQISEPIDINTSEFVGNPYLRAFFPTLEGLRKVFRQSSELRDYFSETEYYDQSMSCALLCMRKSEETVLGMELDGDRVVRDVKQTRVSFSGHRIYSPRETEVAARRELKCCLFEGLVVNALEKISELRQKRARLETEQQMLSSRLRSGRERAVDDALDSSIVSNPRLSRQQLTEQLDAVKNQLREIGYITPEISLKLVNDTLSRPEDFVKLEHLSLSIDKSGIRRDELMASPSVSRLELSEVRIMGQPARVVTLARIGRDEIEKTERLSS
jgi:DNA-binding transcriptional MerR regulator